MNYEKKKFYNKLAVVLCFLTLIACKEKQIKKTSQLATLPFYDDPRFTPNWLDSNSNDLTDFHRIPAFELVNQEGQKVTEKTFEGKIYVADFIFTTCPGICPKMTSNMALLQEEFAADNELLLLSHSVTPELDSVAVLRDYAIKNGVRRDKWHLVTGDRSHIYDLGRNYYFAEEDLGARRTEDDFLHTENFVLVDKNRHIRGIYNGLNATSVKQLMADIKVLKQEGHSLQKN